MKRLERTHDYPSKNAARRAWMRFLPEFFPPETSGLYLSGTENLELDGYLAKGLNPARLISPEHISKLQSFVEAGARGVKIVRGHIQDAVRVVETERLSPLSFVHLDFDGMYGTFIQQILSVFRVFPSESGWLAVTSYSARDEETMRQGHINTSKFYSGLPDPTTFWEVYGSMLRRHVSLKRLLDSRVADHAHLTRELGFLWWIALILGLVGPLKHGERGIDEKHLARIDGVLQRITRRALEISGEEKELRVFREPELSSLLHAHQSVLWPESFSHLAYYTASRQPMRMWMFKVTAVPQGLPRPTHQEVLSQVWRLASRASLVYIDEAGEEVRIG